MHRIDCHMHHWTLALERYYGLWMTPALKSLYGDFGPRDAAPVMTQSGIDGVVLVSAANSIHETGYLMGVADSQDYVRGVVAWIDMLAPGAADDIRYWSRFRKLKGFRPYLQDLPEDDWVLKPQLAPALRAMVESGLSFDILIKPRHVAHAVEFVRRNPDLMVVVDHMAKPEIRNSGFEPWRREMEAFRALKHVHCKISGILTEDGDAWSLERIRPYVDAVIDIFGPDRLMFGSDWPVVNLVADYGRWVDAVETLLGDLTRADQQKIWADNGERFYRL
ncbi:MAG: amidohydrolase [Bradyrhizobium sp.]|nr:MAG: amidohydrolase [Bradyrhizobium sp.]